MERKAGTAVKPGETELARQLEYIRAIRAENDAFAAENGRKKKFYSLAMGCQMNAHDSEKLEGMLDEMGFDRTDEETEADFIIYNTCCVRENAEQKVYGKLGWLKHYKETKNPDAVIALCGCMMQQETVLQTLRQKYRHVDIVFGTFNLLWQHAWKAAKRCMISGRSSVRLWRICLRFGISPIRHRSILCLAATTSVPTASCRMCAAESAAVPLRISSRR